MDASQLKRFSLFKDVDESALNKIAPFTMLVEFPEGKMIIQEGGFSNDFYAIDEGTVKVERAGEKIADARPRRRLRRAGPAREAGALRLRHRDLVRASAQDRALGARRGCARRCPRSSSSSAKKVEERSD